MGRRPGRPPPLPARSPRGAGGAPLWLELHAVSRCGGEGGRARRCTPGIASPGSDPGDLKLQSSHPDEMPFDDDLYRTISMGFPQASMPAFSEFTVDERWSLVDYVKSMSPRHFDANPPKRRIPGPPAGASADPVRGAQLFTSGIQCAQCHGTRGHGEGPAASALADAEGQPVAVRIWPGGRSPSKGDRAPWTFTGFSRLEWPALRCPPSCPYPSRTAGMWRIS